MKNRNLARPSNKEEMDKELKIATRVNSKHTNGPGMAPSPHSQRIYIGRVKILRRPFGLRRTIPMEVYQITKCLIAFRI